MKVSTADRARLGAKRCQYRRRIQEIMDGRGISSMRGLAREIGISDVAVYRTLAGNLHSPKVLDKLREMGVPEQYLCDPRRSGNAA